jgi:hypothetical protein
MLGETIVVAVVEEMIFVGNLVAKVPEFVQAEETNKAKIRVTNVNLCMNFFISLLLYSSLNP